MLFVLRMGGKLTPPSLLLVSLPSDCGLLLFFSKMFRYSYLCINLLLLHLRLSSTHAANDDDDNDCPCLVMDRPDWRDKEKTARWMVHSLDWGVLSTISSRFGSEVPFGNVYSFVDGSCDNPTGTPYFLGTYMDQTFQDMQVNANASLTLSEAGLASVCGVDVDKHLLEDCSIGYDGAGDPESPLCARLTFTGTLVQVDASSAEFHRIQHALLHRHPQMAFWPADHNWVIIKLLIQNIWLIDFFGGASILDVDKYYAENPGAVAAWNK